MNNKSFVVELMNIEKYEFCILDLKLNKVTIVSQKSSTKFTGLYYKNDECFFAIFPTSGGPYIYYNKKIYPITKELIIEYIDLENKGIFKIKDYNMEIKYNYSKYLDFDSWSQKEDIDIFYKIFSNYKMDSFYQLYSNEKDINSCKE